MPPQALWTKAEDAKLFSVCGCPTEEIRAAIPGRSLHAIKCRALRLGIQFRQGVWTLHRLHLRTGYTKWQIQRAAKELRQEWRRTSEGRAGRWLINEEQAERLLEHLGSGANVPFPKRTGKWSYRWARKHSRCRRCKTTAAPHVGLGLCGACYQRDRKV